MTIAAIFLPLLGAFIAGFFGRWIGDRGAQLITCAGIGLAALFGVILFVEVALGGQARTKETAIEIRKVRSGRGLQEPVP